MHAPSDFVPSGFFALRTPLLPFDELAAWSEGLESAAALGRPDPLVLEGAVTRDRAVLRARLLAAFERPELLDALFVASPSLEQRLQSLRRLQDPAGEAKTEAALAAYFTRAASRPTPFGLFAGCSVGRIGARTNLELCDRSAYARHSRLDMDYLWALAHAIERDPTLCHTLVYRPNSSLYRGPRRLHYAYAALKGGIRGYHLAAVEASPWLVATLERARGGASLATLAEHLVDDEVGWEEARDAVWELADRQLLVPDVHPVVTGPEPLQPLISVLGRHEATLSVAARLSGAGDALSAIDGRGPGADPAAYREVADALEGLPARPDLSRLFQVDLVKPAPAAALGETVLREITRSAQVLHRLARPPAEDPLAGFRAAFLQRYDDREVPLMEVLDEELGIGFGRSASPATEASPLLEGLSFPPPGDQSLAWWSQRDAHLLRRLMEVVARGDVVMSLDDHDLDSLALPQLEPLPDAFAVMATLAASSPAAVERGEFRVLVHGATGPSGARLLGRFCHSDPTLQGEVEGHLQAEEALHPDHVFAEIVHLPEGRIGNVLCRPVLRRREVSYLGRSGASDDRQIPVDDLVVSVTAGRVVLRSRTLGREVVPRLTNAHNYAGPCVSLYRFLCTLQHQGVAGGLSWDWGPLASAPFLPRVILGRLVLARARWKLAKTDINRLTAAPGAAQFAAAASLRSRLNLPRYVALADGDNELVVDLDNVASVAMLASQVKGRSDAALVEMFPTPEELCAYGPEGRFVHEIVVPFVLRQPAPPGSSRRTVARVNGGAALRRFPPGSEWLYVKLYSGPSSADQVLREVVAPMVREATVTGAADRWFFVRYGDPDWHLRVRLHGDPGRLERQVLPHLQTAAAGLIEAGLSWRVQIDTYEREIERYGGARGTEVSEQLFHADSQAVLAIVEMLVGDEGANARWRLALRGVDLLLSDLGLDLGQKRAWARSRRDAFAREFKADGQLRRQLGIKYRAERASLEELLDPAGDRHTGLTPGLEALQRRSVALASVTEQLRALQRDDQLTSSLADLAASYAHMHVNRLLRSGHRAQELVLYDLLDRIYAGREARVVTRS